MIFSIIIPLFNRENFIADTIASVRAQTCQEWECIVVDDGSTDNSLAWVREITKNDPRFKVFERPDARVKGANACRNYGYDKSSGDYILWFDSDDIFRENYFKECLDVIEQFSDADVFTCSHKTFKDVLPEITTDTVTLFDFKVEDFILRKLFLQTGAAVWRRAFIDLMRAEDHLFDEGLSQSQDYDLFARAFLRNPKRIQIPKVLYFFRRDNDSISTQFLQGNRVHLDSFLRVKEKLSRATKDNSVIVVGLLNHVLGSLRHSIVNPDDTFFKKHIDYLENWTKQYDFVPKKKIKKIIRLARMLRLTKKGVSYFKDQFVVESDVQ